MRRVVLLLIALIVLAVPAYAGYWFYLAHRLSDAAGPWAEARRGEGYDLRWRTMAVEGFPFAFRLHFQDASLLAQRPAPYEAKSPEVTVSAKPWQPRDWQFAAPQGIRFAPSNGSASLEAETLDGTVTTESDAPTVVTVTAHNLAGRGTAQGLSVDSGRARLTLPAHAPASHTESLAAAEISLDKVTLPMALPALGAQIDAFSLAASVKGRLLPGPLEPALAAWRNDGGTLEIERSRLAWGKLTVAINGTVALDAGLQPMGALTAEIQNPDVAVDAAVASGALKARFAGLLKTVLSAMTKAGADGQRSVDLPIAVQDSQLSLVGLPVTTLPHIVWK